MKKSNKSSNTKKSLWASGLSLLVCCAVLVGTTFAWFTDSVTNQGNKIQAGRLNVSLAEWDTKAGGYVEVGEAPIFNYNLWEPGYTDIAAVKIGNEGTLALKYRLDIIADGATDLAKVIDVYYYRGGTVTQQSDLPTNFDALKGNENYVNLGTLDKLLADEDNNGVANGHLNAGESDFAIIALHMQETANDDYQGASIGTTFDIVLNATQYTSEQDGFDNNQYDASTPLPEVINSTDYDSLQEAINAAQGDIVVVKENQSPNSTLNLLDDITLKLGSNIIDGTNNGGNGININGDNQKVVIQATNGGIQMDNERCIAVSAENSDIMVDGGNYSLAGTHNAYFMEDRGGGSNTVTIQNVTYTGERGVQFSSTDNNTILIKDSNFTTTGYSAIFIGGNNNVCTLEHVTISGNRLMAADSSHTGDDGYSIINIKSGTYKCSLTTSDHCTISITGGSFSDNPTEYLAEGYKAEKSGQMWVVTPV